MKNCKPNNKLTLRPFLDSDKELFARWLNAEHVAKWYSPSQDWLDEIEGRDGEYAFIRHFIAELDGNPIGFAQYYEYCLGGETWHGNTDIDGAYSIDYLIGNAAYLGKGFGKSIILALADEIRQKENAKLIIVQPSPNNKASCGALLSCCFSFDKANGLYRLDF